MPLDPTAYLAAIASESGAFADAVEHGPLDAPVTGCPGWTLGDLGAHMERVQRWAAGIVRTVAQERPDRAEPVASGSAAELATSVREGTAELLAALGAADPAAKVWTFSFDRSMAFWFRRQAHEITVHRWDAQAAIGAAEPLDAELAADGVDEWLEMLAVRGAGAIDADGEQTIHLHCTDVEGEWLVRRSRDGLDIERAHAKGDVAARGSASDLDLYVWGRIPADALEVFGDADLLESFRAGTARRPPPR